LKPFTPCRVSRDHRNTSFEPVWEALKDVSGAGYAASTVVAVAVAVGPPGVTVTVGVVATVAVAVAAGAVEVAVAVAAGAVEVAVAVAAGAVAVGVLVAAACWLTDARTPAFGDPTMRASVTSAPTARSKMSLRVMNASLP
jgi:hypothetical protein